MPRYKDIVGEVFGRLTVIEPTDQRSKDNSMIWKCKCECGNITLCNTKNLRSGNTKSCGCLHREMVSKKFRKDITGQHFGKLTALNPTEERVHHCVVWNCLCDCGNYKQVATDQLISGNVKSCGCLRSQGNQKIMSLLQDLGLNFIAEYFVIIDKIRYAYDFAICVDNKVVCLIEYDGILHFEQDIHHGWNTTDNWEKTHKNDLIKNGYAEVSDLPLIRIPYTEYNKLTKSYLLERIKELCTLDIL